MIKHNIYAFKFQHCLDTFQFSDTVRYTILLKNSSVALITSNSTYDCIKRNMGKIYGQFDTVEYTTLVLTL